MFCCFSYNLPWRKTTKGYLVVINRRKIRLNEIEDAKWRNKEMKQTNDDDLFQIVFFFSQFPLFGHCFWFETSRHCYANPIHIRKLYKQRREKKNIFYLFFHCIRIIIGLESIDSALNYSVNQRVYEQTHTLSKRSN